MSFPSFCSLSRPSRKNILVIQGSQNMLRLLSNARVLNNHCVSHMKMYVDVICRIVCNRLLFILVQTMLHFFL